MKISAYQKFAEAHAQRVGGQRLLDAMLRQVNGDDEDAAEINWRVLGYDNSTEVYANVSANYDKAVIRFSIDERQPASTGEFSTSVDFAIHDHPLNSDGHRYANQWLCNHDCCASRTGHSFDRFLRCAQLHSRSRNIRHDHLQVPGCWSQLDTVDDRGNRNSHRKAGGIGS